MRAHPGMHVDMPGLVDRVEKMTADQINALPFGVVRLDSELQVIAYSDVERQQSGFRKEAQGRPFFLEIAPCLNTAKCRGRIDAALAKGTLDITFDQIANLRNGTRDVDLHVRVLAASGGGCWIFTEMGE